MVNLVLLSRNLSLLVFIDFVVSPLSQTFPGCFVTASSRTNGIVPYGFIFYSKSSSRYIGDSLLEHPAHIHNPNCHRIGIALQLPSTQLSVFAIYERVEGFTDESEVANIVLSPTEVKILLLTSVL